MSNMSRRKGVRVEIETVHELQRYGIPATKRSGMYVAGHDIDATVAGRILRVEVKARAAFATLHRWLDGADVLARIIQRGLASVA